MADDVDQDALAAEWGVDLDDDDGAETLPDHDDDDQDDIAAEWAAMIDDTPEIVEMNQAGAERILNQDEIDGLLGFDPNEGGLRDTGGIRAIIDSAMVSYERLPMLEIVFDRLVRLMTASLRTFTSDNVEVSLDSITSVRFGDYLNSIPLPAVLSVFKAEEWDNFGLFAIDSSLIYSIVDVLLGGRRSTSPIRIEGRPYTTIEMNLVERMVEVLLIDAEHAFAPLSPVKFNLDRLETNPRFAAISRPANAAILINLRIDMEERGGRIEMVLPYATIEPIRDLLLQMFMGEKFGRDSIWEEHLATELWHAEVEIDAVLDEQDLPLSTIMALEVGKTLMLDVAPRDNIKLRCGDVLLTEGKMGRTGESIAVNVSRELTKPRMSLAAFEKAEEMKLEGS
ncbi:MAG: flagellar motor switch protein FliM [Fimbriimonadaceae bacterium]|nr:flagellar motor switch protein FliM [Alphaproteobacteria bacterium]